MDEEKSQAIEATKNIIDKTKELTTHEIHNVYDNAKVVSDAIYDFDNVGKNKTRF